MGKRHLSFEELDFDDPVDHSHLEECEECRKQLAAFRFLAFQVKSAPRMEIPPFFAQRVTRLTQKMAVPFSLLLQRAARQMIPVFVALVLTTGFLLFQITDREPANDYAELLFEQPLQENISLDYVLNSLAEEPAEDPVE
jgi:anti-sigma factor RsiW